MLTLKAAKSLAITKLHIGQEGAPVLVVDNFVDQPELLIDWASKLHFEKNSPFYPGVRARVPAAYQQLIVSELQDTLRDFFNLPTPPLSFSVCHYSIVTTPPEQLKLLQRIPHFDSVNKDGLAAVHYLFKGNMGGTSFYRHRKTGFEAIDESRQLAYFRSLESENDGPNLPKKSDGYINGDTCLFECIEQQAAVFNRLIIYRRNSLHSGAIPLDYHFSDDPLNGRLTISSFIDCL